MTAPTVTSVESLLKVHRLGQTVGLALLEDLDRWWVRFRQARPLGAALRSADPEAWQPCYDFGQTARGTR